MRRFLITIALLFLGSLYAVYPLPSAAAWCKCTLNVDEDVPILGGSNNEYCVAQNGRTCAQVKAQLVVSVLEDPANAGAVGSGLIKINCDDTPYLNNVQGKCADKTGAQLRFTELLQEYKIKTPGLRVTIPGVKFTDIKDTLDEDGNIYLPWISELIAGIYKFGIAMASIVAAVMIILQGARIVTSGGGEQKTAAYKKIGQIFIGLAIAWGSFLILSTVNKDLVEFKALKIKYIPTVEISTENSGEIVTADDLAAPRTSTSKVPLFKQGDFKQVPYGLCGTSVAQSGCGPTSMAMVLKYYEAEVDPALVATTFFQEGYRACSADCKKCNGTSWTAFTKSRLLSQNNMETEIVGKPERMRELLKQQKPLIAAVSKESIGRLSTNGTLTPFTKGGHFIVLTGMDERGNISVNDPGRAITLTTEDLLMPGLKGVWYVHPKNP